MKKYTTLFLLFFIATSFGQEYAADRAFKDFSYIKSAKLYKRVYQKGDSSKLVLSRLADSYYFNNETEEAEKWYSKLFNLYEQDSLTTENYFKYAQTLKTNGNYKESDKWLTKLKEFNTKDSRSKKLADKTDYLSEFSKNKEKFQHIHNLSINTPYSDYGTFITDSLVYFASARPKNFKSGDRIYKWNGQPFLNVYQSTEKVISNVNDSIHKSDLVNPTRVIDINTKYHEASAIVTKDGATMYFTRDNFDGRRLRNDRNNVAHLKIYKATKIDGEWDKIVELPFNSNKFSNGHPALSPDEKTLYFVSDMPNGYGKTDLYRVRILENNEYGTPINLGADINTEGREMFPFISKDNFLYFSSDGHIGLGSLDIFESKIDTVGLAFSSVNNLAKPINSKKDDFSFSLNSTSKRGYFSSNRAGGKGDDDIYSFFVYPPKKKVIPVCKQEIIGVVKDEITKKLMPGATIILLDENKKEVEKLVVGNDASFKFILPCDKEYTIKASKQYYNDDLLNFVSTPVKGELTPKELFLNLNNDFVYSDNLEKIIRIDPIYFDVNKSKIRPDAAIVLDRVVAIMKKYPELIVRSSSHTDSRGRDSYNEALSTRRANSSVQYIVSKGITQNRITGVGYGETQLVNHCGNRVRCSKDEHQLNRRTEFVVVNFDSKN
ncbi:outer membrane protein OmpA-like peptidoglycan-associated protein [Lutibacter sp. Hel_I_33_5]|uniref:OmpA family protein n=1 Tax=Lutibacter sp. Hel_I_33_5 TaxID=1566289 RepID=UPI0011A41042|nr:OmpA family protein [Lutibacter sp. Hel_I_33_5]TVZ57295.1 outer membrane protein OmpA-like peptidoglycan-associated protein [Lutibacter sp. Hel_I_33_5]